MSDRRCESCQAPACEIIAGRDMCTKCFAALMTKPVEDGIASLEAKLRVSDEWRAFAAAKLVALEAENSMLHGALSRIGAQCDLDLDTGFGVEPLRRAVRRIVREALSGRAPRR